MKRWKDYKILKEDSISPSITDCLKQLKDMGLTNEGERKEFIKIITHMCLSSDPKARLFIKQVGQTMPPIIMKILNDSSSLKPNGGEIEVRTGGTINMDSSKRLSTKVNKL